MAIAWIDGQWGSPHTLGLPLADRGLQLADGLFETVLVEAGEPRLLQQHLQRWQAAAQRLAMASPPAQEQLLPLIEQAVLRVQLHASSGALRLNWSRGQAAPGSSSRGIDLPGEGESPLQHQFWLVLTPHTPSFTPLTAMVSRHERRNAASRLSGCKTFAYGQAIQARWEARAAGADEALLLSTSGELCCGASANLLVRRAGQWLTPPLASGCLPGVMRQRALELGLAREHRLEPKPQAGDQWLLINSLSCRPIQQLDGWPLDICDDATSFWRQLL